MSYEPDQEAVVSFLRSTSTTRRRRVRPLVIGLRRAFKLTLGALPLVSLAAWVVTSPTFALKSFQVEGMERVEIGWIERQIESRVGENLVLLRLGELQRGLEQHTWVRAVELHKRLPDRIEVRVLEHVPRALLRTADAVYFVDLEGRIIAELDADAETLPSMLVLQSEGEPAEDDAQSDAPAVGRSVALQLAAMLENGPIGWARSVRQIDLLGAQDFRLWMSSLSFPVLVRADSAIERLRLLDALLPKLQTDFDPLAAVDLRFQRRIVLKPDPNAGDPASSFQSPANGRIDERAGDGQAG